MAPIAPELPVRFPCWCRATYSWGGETKRDLGFIEGDLIECLNAGDGSWWMGRLRRDKRMVGLFPSNFVEVLPDHFQPSRNASPLPLGHNGSVSRASSPNPAAGGAAPQKNKSVFRKPFTAYAAAGQPNPAAAARRLRESGGTTTSSPTGSLNKHRPYSSMKRGSNDSRESPPASNTPRASHLSQFRAVSPRPTSRAGYASRSGGVSPEPSFEQYSHSRAVSPAPSFQAHHPRAPSPNPYADIGSSPPPPAPPPHRVAYNQSRAPSPQPYVAEQDDQAYHVRSHSPMPPASPRFNHTPSPLTNAMNDVMESLQDMSLSRQGSPEEPSTPPSVWSPEAFDMVRKESKMKARPATSVGIGMDSGYGSEDNVFTLQKLERQRMDAREEEDPQLSSYVRRMESRLRKMHEAGEYSMDSVVRPTDDGDPAPAPPLKGSQYQPRPQSSFASHAELEHNKSTRLKKKRSAYEMGKSMLDRTFTTKTTATNSTNTTSSTERSLMSHSSAGAVSATSAGSYHRRKFGLGSESKSRPTSVLGLHSNSSKAALGPDRPETPFTGVSYHSSHDSRAGGQTDLTGNAVESAGVLGGLAQPKKKKSGFFRKMIDSAKANAATARSTMSSAQGSRPVSRQERKSMIPNGVTAIAGGTAAPKASDAAQDMGLGGAMEWMAPRRDLNRSNSLSRHERNERAERCQMMDIPVIAPVDELLAQAEGDEGLDGLPISEATDFTTSNLSLVDKSARFINNLPPTTTAASLAQGYVCRPYRSDVQRLRAIFTWVSERIAWEEDFEGDCDTRRVIQTKRGCSEEVAVLVMEMCAAVGLHAEVVRGYLKTPGEVLDFDMAARPNHWWNAVIVDGEWRIMDCSLASPTNPRRSLYSSANPQVAESWWFLARPMEVCYTHVPLLPEQQHVCPPVHHDILMALPCACPPFFKHGLRMFEYDTSLLAMDSLELVHVQFLVPDDVECVAEVEARAFVQDADGDFFESGDVVRKRALAQAEWVGGQKRYTVKAVMPGDEGQGVLKVYAGKRGLMHSIKSNPHALAVAFPISHIGQNPPFDFLLRHPTPHAARHDLYVAQPQCARLNVNNTIVFHVRQHPSSLGVSSPNPDSGSNAGFSISRPVSRAGATSPLPFARPTSAMSTHSATFSASGSQYSNPSNASSGSGTSQKPAKLAIQLPSGKIIRLVRKSDAEDGGPGGTWETILKLSERGTHRGLVLADRSARWCVFAEWECV